MKSLFLLCSSVISLQLNIFAQQPNAVVDVQQYIFNVELNDRNDSVKCVATINYRLLKRTSSISFDLISKKADGKGMIVNSVTENSKSLNYSHNKDTLQIRLPTPGEVNEEKSVQIQYNGIPADGLIIAKNKYGSRTFFSDHWPNRARNWLPCIDHPSDKAGVEFIVTAPVHYQVISNGLMIEETNLAGSRKLTHYKETVPIPMKVAAIGAADFAVRHEGEINNIPVHSWVYPEDRVQGLYDFGLAVNIFPFFIKNIGAYPYKKLANVQSKTIFGGMENAGAIFYSEKSVTGKRSAEALIAHEIAHQWFGNMVTEFAWAHVWLSEGFATYMTFLYMESKYGQDTAQKMRLKDRVKVIAFSKQNTSAVVDSSTTDYLALLNANSYQKGGWILHMLRKQLGDSLFWKGIRSYYARYAGKNAVTDDLRIAMESASGKDLRKFFQQWLYTPGHPVLAIQWKYDNMSKVLTLNITQQQPVPFEFPIEVNIRVAAENPITTSILTKDKSTTISIPLSGKPLKFEVDPEVNLLYEGVIREIR